MSSPPSFDALFSTQRSQQPGSAQSSLEYPFSSGSTSGGGTGAGTGTSQYTTYTQQLGDERIVSEEPTPLLSRVNSSDALRHRALTGTPGINPRDDDGPERKDSFPFDPSSSSTLISTAPNGVQKSTPTAIAGMNAPAQPSGLAQMHFPIPHDNYGMGASLGNSRDHGYTDQYTMFDTQQSYAPQRQDFSMPISGPVPQEPFYGDNSTPFSNNEYTPAPQTDWTANFLGDPDNDDSRHASWAGSVHDQAELEGMLADSTQFDEQLDELQRIISNASSQGTPADSRVPSPFLSEYGGEQRPTSSFSPGHVRHDSQSSLGRSPSPFAQPGMAPSPPVSAHFNRTGSASLASSPYFSKPQSPPALVIPNQHSPSPVLPPIVTSGATGRPTTSNGAVGSGHHYGNSLFPPVNPALEHLTGMAGISPIAPSADGPMIYIQPSTPISGMKEGRGVFDAAIRRANAQNQQIQGGGQQQQQQQQLTHANSSTGSRAADGAANPQQQQQQPDPTVFMQDANAWAQTLNFDGLAAGGPSRPRAKSDSYTTGAGEAFDRQALLQILSGQMAPQFNLLQQQQQQQAIAQMQGAGDPNSGNPWVDSINAWRMSQALEAQQAQAVAALTLDPRNLPGNTQEAFFQHQLEQLQAQRARFASLGALNTNTGQAFKYEPGEFSPTSMAFYQQLGLNAASGGGPSDILNSGTASAPGFQTVFQNIPQQVMPHTAGPSMSSFLTPGQNAGGGLGPRRRSFAEGTTHHAAGAGTPGYGVEFTLPGAVAGGTGRLSPALGHRRAARSEDFGRGGTGWGVGAGGSTADFLQSITNPDDGTLLPPSMRGRSSSHSRHSSVSSARSPSPAPSVSSQGSSFSHHSHMDLPEGVQVSDLVPIADLFPHQEPRPKLAKMKVTSMATEVASQSRRTNSGVFKCPVPGCGSTFTRHFNLKGHLRSHNDERPYKCLYDGCPKAIVGFARQHDCKRHMLLHEGLRPFECEGCGKKFARLDALTRHHKSEQGQECALSHPLPTNPDGSPMSESQYKAYRMTQQKVGGSKGRTSLGGLSTGDFSTSAEDMDEDFGNGSGMEEYDRA